ncbi:hypothetical protein ymoll0001_32050 [Yersinia mollaretii ATCC 43969]|uniref:Uncharacterized protein n=1 Tax=Yersinia mollaretii (strain ATCC 43969 / DSM 18520 / CIP 103324 / CNY 7263 / WAIP 204) TaxID=349967 RepID=A0ABM9Y7J8_YERMW|nr:hypothetical protein ymoll0001_32050 [Yersinia mollaretii ATCC 43969]
MKKMKKVPVIPSKVPILPLLLGISPWITPSGMFGRYFQIK